ncbi:MAG: hypothetical protein NVS3B7_04810 [Candidatus Elarobacter sp.]
MKRTIAALFTAFLLCGVTPAYAQPASNGAAQLKYKVLPTVKASVVPNYLSGYGPSGGFGSGVTPAVGPAASFQGGTVDFGNVVVGYQYLYKYAAQVNVQTNDSAGFIVYAEGATDLNGSNPVPTPASFPLATTLYWLVNAPGNGPFSPAQTFNRTSGTPIAGGAGGIDYSAVGGKPSGMAVIWSSATSGTLSQGYDYQLRLSGSVPISQFDVYIVYTVIGN